MREIETDYLVIGAGAAGMAFVDALIETSEAEVVMVDRRHRPGGHWIDAYPFVRLHQPSAIYGVASRTLGSDRIDETGPNAGFYERASAAEICDYYDRVLDEHLLPSGQVRFFGSSDYDASDGHRFTSTLTGETTTVKVRRKVVDATYVASEVPSTHTPPFEIDDDVRVIPPNDLVDLAEPVTGFTVLGAGKTSMDACCWLLDQGVDPDRIRWVRPREAWVIDRVYSQPLELVAWSLELYSRLVETAAEASGPTEFGHRLESEGVLMRIDPDVEPEILRGAILSTVELEALRRISNVVRLGRVRRIGSQAVVLDEGTISSEPGHVYVDCTAAGFSPGPARPIFEPDRITLQLITIGVAPWSMATLGYVEASRHDDEDKNRLCPPSSLNGVLADVAEPFAAGLRGQALRMAEPDIAAWNDRCRLNPLRGASERLDDPRVQEPMMRMMSNMGPALENLERLIAQPTPA